MTRQKARALPRHLRRLEAESIDIMRDVVAEFKKTVMLHSMGAPVRSQKLRPR
jgi:sulfate adenylyltransferase subunit 2